MDMKRPLGWSSDRWSSSFSQVSDGFPCELRILLLSLSTQSGPALQAAQATTAIETGGGGMKAGMRDGAALWAKKNNEPWKPHIEIEQESTRERSRSLTSARPNPSVVDPSQRLGDEQIAGSGSG
ncbi:unnamed protein product, partial [Pleuronectes platessa]